MREPPDRLVLLLLTGIPDDSQVIKHHAARAGAYVLGLD
jgi:hypothetical protein